MSITDGEDRYRWAVRQRCVEVAAHIAALEGEAEAITDLLDQEALDTYDRRLLTERAMNIKVELAGHERYFQVMTKEADALGVKGG